MDFQYVLICWYKNYYLNLLDMHIRNQSLSLDLAYLEPMVSAYKNRIDFNDKSIHWFLYEGNNIDFIVSKFHL